MMKHIFKNEFTIALVAAMLFIPFLGNVHLFDWDEINFAESAREMIASGNYFSVQINFTRFTEKPPLFFWMQVLSMKVFGVNEFLSFHEKTHSQYHHLLKPAFGLHGLGLGF